MINILLLAPPAAGKGTQAMSLSSKYHVPHISTGALFREVIQDDKELGKEIKDTIANGSLVEDSIVLELVQNRLNNDDCSDGFILDGYPRTLEQAYELEDLLHKINKKIEYVFLLDVPKELLIQRVLGRRQCDECGQIYNTNEESSRPQIEGKCDKCGSTLTIRSDDNETSYLVRYDIYEEETLTLIDYYSNKGILYKIDGNRRAEYITEEITSILEKS